MPRRQLVFCARANGGGGEKDRCRARERERREKEKRGRRKERGHIQDDETASLSLFSELGSSLHLQ